MTRGTARSGPRRPSQRPRLQRLLASSAAAPASQGRRTGFGVAARSRTTEAACRKSLTGCAFVVEWPVSDRIVAIPPSSAHDSCAPARSPRRPSHDPRSGRPGLEATPAGRSHGAGRITASGRPGNLAPPFLHPRRVKQVIADSRTWLGYLAKERSIVWAILRWKIRLKGSPKLLVAFGKCFPS